MTNLNEQEIDLIVEALNQHWHQANKELQNKNLGDLERKYWEQIKINCWELMYKLNS